MLPSGVNSVVRSGGQPLDSTTRDFMEQRFGQELGDVRVHTDARAAESARAVHALAYTVGQDVVIGGRGSFASTIAAPVLLAHELAHTIQQRRGTGPPPSADPLGAVESSANAAAQVVGNGGSLVGALPASGVGLACAPVPLEELPEVHLQKELEQVSEKLKQQAYDGRDGDLRWQARLLATIRAKTRSREPGPSPPVATPQSAPAPRPDPHEELEAAVAEAKALLARMEGGGAEEKRSKEREASTNAAAERRKHDPVFNSSDLACQRRCFTDDDVYGPGKAANKRIDEQIERDRKAVAGGPLDKRIWKVRARLQASSEHWTSPKVAASYLTPDQVWKDGFDSGDFAEGEKRGVFEEQGAHLRLLNEKFAEKFEQEKAQAEVAQARAWEARGDQLSSPTMFIQPFAYAALGPLIGAAYAGSQTGLLVGETYNACKGGLSSDCGVAVAQDAAAIAMHRVTRGKQDISEPMVPSGAVATRRALRTGAASAEPDFVITRRPTLNRATGRMTASMVETASGRTLDAEIDPRTGFGQIVDRKTREVIGEFRNGKVVPPSKLKFPAGSQDAPTGSSTPPKNRPVAGVVGATATNAPASNAPLTPASGAKLAGSNAPAALIQAPSLTAGAASTPVTALSPPSAAITPTAPAAPTTSRTAAAYARLAETQQVLARVRERLTAAEARHRTAQGNAQAASELNKGAARGSSNKPTAGGWLVEVKAELRAAKSELAAARASEASVAGEEAHVARTQAAIIGIERELVEINARQTEISNDPALVAGGHTRNVAPPRTAPRGKEYRDLENQKAKLEKTLIDRTDDLTRNVRDQVAGQTPGKRGRAVAIANANAVARTVPAMKPVGNRPVDVTTGRLMISDQWETDHIISKNTIATDPRFLRLDPAGRYAMINGVPENYLPMSKTANGMKADMTVDEFIRYRERIGEPIPSGMADGLRVAQVRAHNAVEAMWDKLLAGK